MNDANQKVEVNVMGKLYSVVCPQQQQEELKEAVSFLNNRVEELKRKTKEVGSSERAWNRDSLLAVIALNLSYELLKINTTVSSKASEVENLVERIKNSFAPDIDDAMRKTSEMSL